MTAGLLNSQTEQVIEYVILTEYNSKEIQKKT